MSIREGTTVTWRTGAAMGEGRVTAIHPRPVIRRVKGVRVKRLGTPDDIAHGVLFFASEYAGWITGQVLAIDGGR